MPCSVLLLLLCGVPHAHAASDRAVQTVIQADLAAQANPDGLMVSVGGYRRWVRETDDVLGIPSSYLQTGYGLGTTPAFGRASLYAEWLAAVFAKVRVQYDRYRFYGTNRSLLSFPSATAAFGRADVEAMQGSEEAGNGSRLLIRPTLYAKAGPVLFVNQTDLAYFHFTGRGPYYLDWTYEALLKDDDRVWENRTNVLLQMRKGPGAVSLLAGPYFEVMRTGAADLTRRRAGMMAYWVPWNALGALLRPRFYAQVGYYLQDRNSEGSFTAALGMGIDLE